MFDHLLESSRRDDSNKLSNIGFGEERDIFEIKTCVLSGALHTTGRRATAIPEYATTDDKLWGDIRVVLSAMEKQGSKSEKIDWRGIDSKT